MIWTLALLVAAEMIIQIHSIQLWTLMTLHGILQNVHVVLLRDQTIASNTIAPCSPEPIEHLRAFASIVDDLAESSTTIVM